MAQLSMNPNPMVLQQMQQQMAQTIAMMQQMMKQQMGQQQHMGPNQSGPTQTFQPPLQ